MSLLAILAIQIAAAAQGQPATDGRVVLYRTHAHSGPSRLELACPPAPTPTCEARRYLNGAVVAEATVARAKSEQIFKDFLATPVGRKKSAAPPGQTVHWELIYGNEQASGGIVRSEKLARPVISLEAELLALVRQR